MFVGLQHRETAQNGRRSLCCAGGAPLETPVHRFHLYWVEMSRGKASTRVRRRKWDWFLADYGEGLLHRHLAELLGVFCQKANS